MTPRFRKLIGAAIMIAFVMVYALIAMAVAQSHPVQDAPGLVQALYYVLIGLGWVLPIMPLIKWMEAPSKQPHN
jgi:hypothetical protein